jgi:hypothetical protein
VKPGATGYNVEVLTTQSRRSISDDKSEGCKRNWTLSTVLCPCEETYRNVQEDCSQDAMGGYIQAAL